MKLVRPDVKYRESFLAGLREMKSESDREAWIYLGDSHIDDPATDFDDYVQTLLDREFEPSPGFVPDTTYWAVIENDVVGRISIRHELNRFLLQVGGHIGYIVRPSARRKGYASQMLTLVLQTPRARLLGRVLLTCDETNSFSEKTIRKSGGVLENIIEMAPGQPKKKRFWITVS